jgi:hypothetical protein
MILQYTSDIQEILTIAGTLIASLTEQPLDVLNITKPLDIEYARHLALVVSNLSPLLGNMIEFTIVSLLNKQDWAKYGGKWQRQDPGFPDTIFNWNKEVKPGIEVKTWFPLATEITARFRDSQRHFVLDQTNVAIVAWLPEFLIYGKPKIIGVFIDTGRSLALARDTHYHNPPDYLIIEPEDTASRTANLQQTNVLGHKFQGTPEQMLKAVREVRAWGTEGKNYSYSIDYQTRLKKLLSRYPYRIDTNFSKIDRIQHQGLEVFKTRILKKEFYGSSISRWARDLLWSDEGINTLLNA